jgi:hypothetical protein
MTHASPWRTPSFSTVDSGALLSPALDRLVHGNVHVSEPGRIRDDINAKRSERHHDPHFHTFFYD